MIGVKPEAAPAAKPVEIAQAPARGLVLLAEDNPVNQRVATKLLERLGFTVQTAENGSVAVDAFLSGRFEMIFMDCQMPVMDGYEATKAIRERESTGRTPIIAVTANAQAGEREKCLAAGMDDYVTKPINIAALTLAVDKWMAVR